MRPLWTNVSCSFMPVLMDVCLYDTNNERLYHIMLKLHHHKQSMNTIREQQTNGSSRLAHLLSTLPPKQSLNKSKSIRFSTRSFWAKCCLDTLDTTKVSISVRNEAAAIYSAQVSLTRSMLMRFICQAIHVFWAKIKMKRGPKR